MAEQDVTRRRLGFVGAVVDVRWGAGEGQGAFKKGRPASACRSRADAARRSRRGPGRALREVDGAPDVRARRGSG